MPARDVEFFSLKGIKLSGYRSLLIDLRISCHIFSDQVSVLSDLID